jgi:hypothetical protein
MVKTNLNKGYVTQIVWSCIIKFSEGNLPLFMVQSDSVRRWHGNYLKLQQLLGDNNKSTNGINGLMEACLKLLI